MCALTPLPRRRITSSPAGGRRSISSSIACATMPFPSHSWNNFASWMSAIIAKNAIELEALNVRIFADMTEFLFAQLPQRSTETESVVPTTPGEIAQELMEHLEQANPFFAIWTRYERHGQHANCALSWHEFAARETSSSTKEDLEFTLLMGASLGPLLQHYAGRNHLLPPRTRYAIWFLHYVEQPVRNAQARALLATLLEALESCGSA